MLKKDLKPGFMAFGNKGAVWSDRVHITETGLRPTTLCGLPMLSHNYAEHWEHETVKCEKCLEEYKKLTNEQ